MQPGRGTHLHRQRHIGIQLRNPSWFDPLAPATAQFDKLGKLSTAFSILKGGYVVYESAGKEHQKFGDEFPDWRKKMKGRPAGPYQAPADSGLLKDGDCAGYTERGRSG